MSVRWNDILRLPEAALAGERGIPKAQLVRQGELTKSQEAKLKGVERLSHFATLQKSTTRMLPVRDEEHDIQAVLVLVCELKGTVAPFEIAEIIHGVFPNPTILLFEMGDEIGISTVLKRLSRSERGAVVIERSSYSAMFEADDARYSGLLAAIAFDQLDQSTLVGYLNSLMDATDLARVIPTVGEYPRCPRDSIPKLMDLAKRMAALQHEITALDATLC